MGTTFVMLRDTVALLVALACLVLIISPRVPTGVAGTGGLAALAVGAVWGLDYWANPRMVADTLIGGIGIVAASVLWRAYVSHPARRMGGPNFGRRQTDWMPTQPDATAEPSQTERAP